MPDDLVRRARVSRKRKKKDVTFDLRDVKVPDFEHEIGAVTPKVHKYRRGKIPSFVSIGRELEDTANELRASGFPDHTVRFATLRKLKFRRLGYIHTAVVYGNAFHDGKQHRKRIEVVSKYPLRHIHHAYIYETFTPPWAIQDRDERQTYHKRYLESGMSFPEYRGMPKYDYNVLTWTQVKDGKYAVSPDTVMAQWTEYEQKS